MRVWLPLLLLVFFVNASMLTESLMELPTPYKHTIIQNNSLKGFFLKEDPAVLNRDILNGIPLFKAQPFVKKLPLRYQKTYEDVIYLNVLSGSMIVGLWFLPENLSKWDHDEIQEKNIMENWLDNVEAGPVIDNDEWWINYIGHSLSGAYFYTLARNNGLTIAEATTFNLLMSTFYWEYGVEAFFEIPSAQDLWINPLLGSLLGEGFYKLQQMIRENEGKVWGSETLGSFFMVLFNPEGSLANLLRTEEDRVDFEIVSRFSTYIKEENLRHMMGSYGLWMESYLGFEIRVRF